MRSTLMKKSSKISTAPPAVDREARRRKRHARRWVDRLNVYTSNGRFADRWPGQKWMTLDELYTLRSEALARLEKNHPDVLTAADEVLADDAAARIDVTLEEWKAVGAREHARLRRMRRAIARVLMRAGVEDDPDACGW